MFWPLRKAATPKLQVLLVEDNPGDAVLVRRALTSDGLAWCVLHHAMSLRAALAKLSEQHFDAVLLDMSLPDADGLEGIEAFRRSVPDLPVVVLSGQSEEEIALQAVKAGAQDFLVKDQVPPELLRRSLLYALERHELVRQLELATTQRAADISPESEEADASEADLPIAELEEMLGKGRHLASARQTVFALETRQPVGTEYFVRGPAEPLQSPAALFAAARQRQVPIGFDLQCLRLHLDAADKLPRGHLVFLNVLPSTILRLNAGDLLRLLAERPPSSVCLEIGAQGLSREPGAFGHKVRRLRAAGFRVALDQVDFGANALEMLLVLEPDYVKLSGTSIRAWSDDAERKPWLRRLLTILPELGCTAIASHVETLEDVECVEKWGLRLGQGYALSAPEREEVAEPWTFQL